MRRVRRHKRNVRASPKHPTTTNPPLPMPVAATRPPTRQMAVAVVAVRRSATLQPLNWPPMTTPPPASPVVVLAERKNKQKQRNSWAFKFFLIFFLEVFCVFVIVDQHKHVYCTLQMTTLLIKARQLRDCAHSSLRIKWS